MIKEKVRNNWGLRIKDMVAQEEYIEQIVSKLNESFEGLKTWSFNQVRFSYFTRFKNKEPYIVAWYNHHHEIFHSCVPYPKEERDEARPLFTIYISGIDHVKDQFRAVIKEDNYDDYVFVSCDFESLCLTLVNRLVGR